MTNGCFFYICDEDIEDTVDDIIEVVNVKYEDRAYLAYLISSLFAEKGQSYREFLGLNNKKLTKTEIERKRKNADKLIQKLKNSI